MHKLTIDKLGPIAHCELDIKPYTVLTGYQASGKSTIAKTIYFFRSLKEDVYQLIFKRQHETNSEDKRRNKLKRSFEIMVRDKFLSIFGTSFRMDPEMCISYEYSAGVRISLNLTKSEDLFVPNYVWVEYSEKIQRFLNLWDKAVIVENFDGAELKSRLSDLFSDPFETVYIPAGRSVLTVLGSQFNYFYSTMDDMQKRLLDACTRDYLERVMRLRPQFADGLELIGEGLVKTQEERKLYTEAFTLIRDIIKGRYTYSDGDDRIWVDDERYVKINFASSGQQESVWILNLLYYYLVLHKKAYFIIEEPESNLFPGSQKSMIEYIALVAGRDNEVLMTTHSPYVLGTINNLLYADVVGKTDRNTAADIVSPNKWIDYNKCDARFVADGTAESCMDEELKQIDNTFLDDISRVINSDYDALFDIVHSEHTD